MYVYIYKGLTSATVMQSTSVNCTSSDMAFPSRNSLSDDISGWSFHTLQREREFFIDNLLARIHFIVVMIRWTGLAAWEFDFPFPHPAGVVDCFVCGSQSAIVHSRARIPILLVPTLGALSP